jgi:hypothetical protein
MNAVKSMMLACLVTLPGVLGCSSVQVIDGSAAAVPAGQCNVTVYQTEAQATKKGPIEELCVINGTSSGSFKHTIATAVEKHKGKACACGATNVYIQSQTQSGLDVATVTMVAFRYVENNR